MTLANTLSLLINGLVPAVEKPLTGIRIPVPIGTLSGKVAQQVFQPCAGGAAGLGDLRQAHSCTGHQTLTHIVPLAENMLVRAVIPGAEGSDVRHAPARGASLPRRFFFLTAALLLLCHLSGQFFSAADLAHTAGTGHDAFSGRRFDMIVTAAVLRGTAHSFGTGQNTFLGGAACGSRHGVSLLICSS